jgi:hypothetical protein
MFYIIIGCTTSAPDGSSPRGYSQKFSSIGSSILSSHPSNFINLVLLSSGARLALPMGIVAPEDIRGGGCLQPVIDSNISFAQILFLEFY